MSPATAGVVSPATAGVVSPATRRLTGLHARELVRDRRYFVFAYVFPFLMLGIFLGIGRAVPQGAGGPDFRPVTVPIALFLAVTGSALTVTSAPLASMRARGTLRLLGTTPVGRTRLILTHVVPRVVMVASQLVLLLLVAVLGGQLAVAAVPALFAIGLLGMAMFLGIGYLIGGRSGSADSAANVGTLVQLGSLFLSGLALPLALLPGAVGRAFGLLPTTMFADLMQARMPGGHATHPAWLAAAVVAAAAAGFAALAVRTFRWDQSGEG